MTNPPDAAAIRACLTLSDSDLLAQCDVDTYRASGPGGQKRNKTSSAVRLRHHMSGLSVIAEESRSQHENKARALRRLREKIAVSVRLPAPEQIDWPGGVQEGRSRLEISEKNEIFSLVAA
ncbi:MAG: peptide chain release factor-like protein, partial [Phycisphaerae bacterium]